MIVAIGTFVLSLFGIVGLFSVKAYENTHEPRFGATWRPVLDQYADILKAEIVNLERQATKIGPTLVIIARYGIHQSALAIAHGARTVELGAHSVAERVSMKHSYTRRATNSEFLKQVAIKDGLSGK